MIYLTTHGSKTSVAVNPSKILYVKEAANGCVIYFSSEKSIHVSDNYMEVVGKLVAANQ